MNKIHRLHLCIETVISFLAGFLVAVLYYVAVTKLVSGAWSASLKLTDIPDMAIFGTFVAFVTAALSRAQRGIAEWFMVSGASAMAFNMCIAIYANRSLAIDPHSGAEALYVPVMLIGMVSSLMIAYGYKESVRTRL